jgi:hypothetical protein
MIRNMGLNVLIPMTLVLAGAATPLFGQPDTSQSLAALSTLQPGMWEFKSRDDSAANRSICVSDPRAMLQLRHGAAQCSRFVIQNDQRVATVHYSCPNAGHGQTTLRVETPRLVQVESQGIANKAPFAFTAEGRRVGACAVGEKVSQR